MDKRHLPWRTVVREKGVICRACASYRECSLNIFISTDNFNIPVSGVLRDLLNVEVAEGDGLPDTICRRCVNKLVEFNEFKLMYVNSDTQLRERNDFKWLLEEEVRPWEEFAEEESCAEDDSQGERASELKTEPNGIEVVHLVKEEEVERNTVASEEMKQEMDSAEDVDGGQISTLDMEPFRVDRCNNFGGLTEEPEKESDKVRADGQGISQHKVLDNPSCNPVPEENLQLEYSMANSFVVDCFPESKVRKQKKNVKFYPSNKKFSQLIDRARSVRNHDCEKFCNQSENISHATDYICNYCCTRYSTKKLLAIHIKIHVDGKKPTSVLRMKDFPRRFSQNLSVKDRENVQSVKLETKNISLMQKSLRRKNEKLAVRESSGGKNSGRELNNSRTPLYKSAKPRKEAAFVCDTCGIAFIKKNNLVKHINVHTHLNPFHCRFCGEKLTTMSMLNGDQDVHTGVEGLKCNRCGKCCSTNLDQQKRVVTHTNFQSLKCEICGKNFKRTYNLKRHLLIHAGVKTFKCNECGKMFTTSGNLKMHSAVHTGVKPFKCNECGKMFSHCGSLNRHSLIHTGVKPFKCDECGKMFNDRGNLKRHSLIHTGVKPFQCDECGKMFTSKGELIRHTRIHTGVKPFKCNECGKMFTQSTNFRIHSRIHCGAMQFKCHVCSKQFKWRVGFNRHLLTHADRSS